MTPNEISTDIITCTAILLDLDDTLIDRSAAYEYAYRNFYEDNPAVRDASSWEEALSFFWSLSPWNACEPQDALPLIRERWPGVQGSPESHTEYYYDKLIEGMNPLPGAKAFAALLNSTSKPWGIVTNGGKQQRAKLAKTGFGSLAPFVIVSSEFGVPKPEPDIFIHAATKLYVKPNQTDQILFIGDNPYTDIAGASKAGMQTGWVTASRKYPPGVVQPDFEAKDITGFHRRIFPNQI